MAYSFKYSCIGWAQQQGELRRIGDKKIYRKGRKEDLVQD